MLTPLRRAKTLKFPAVVRNCSENDHLLSPRITAELNETGSACRLVLERELLVGFSWVARHNDAIPEPSLVGELLALEPLRQVSVEGRAVRLEADWPQTLADWRRLGAAGGSLIRRWLDSGRPVLPPGWFDRVPSETDIRVLLEKVIAEELAPYLSKHGGHLHLERVDGNTVYVRMSGGCMGCGSAAATLSGGVDVAFRKAVPLLGAIIDVTSHATGTAPFLPSVRPAEGTWHE
jgi:Fe-S cluster biogenesis protein NfuA